LWRNPGNVCGVRDGSHLVVDRCWPRKPRLCALRRICVHKALKARAALNDPVGRSLSIFKKTRGLTARASDSCENESRLVRKYGPTSRAPVPLPSRWDIIHCGFCPYIVCIAGNIVEKSPKQVGRRVTGVRFGLIVPSLHDARHLDHKDWRKLSDKSGNWHERVGTARRKVKNGTYGRFGFQSSRQECALADE
jgi:hypothetical protein